MSAIILNIFRGIIYHWHVLTLHKISLFTMQYTTEATKIWLLNRRRSRMPSNWAPNEIQKTSAHARISLRLDRIFSFLLLLVLHRRNFAWNSRYVGFKRQRSLAFEHMLPPTATSFEIHNFTIGRRYGTEVHHVRRACYQRYPNCFDGHYWLPWGVDYHPYVHCNCRNQFQRMSTLDW